MNNSKENMKMWNSVCITDANFTTDISFGKRKFTAIDAQFQLRNATEMFGPMGIGWGTRNSSYQVVGKIVIYTAELWYIWEGKEGVTEIASECSVKNDCIKSVTTDALTKGLSKLGFNADVFLNQFDGNKYVDANSSDSKVSVTTTHDKEKWHLQTLDFGQKYPDKTWEYVANNDPSYLSYIASNKCVCTDDIKELANKTLQVLEKKKAKEIAESRGSK
jgi:hypothetical protein